MLKPGGASFFDKFFDKNTFFRRFSASDFECPICYNFLAEPVSTPCKHNFCYKCAVDIAKLGMPCPMCRKEFDRLFVPKIDRNLQ